MIIMLIKHDINYDTDNQSDNDKIDTVILKMFKMIVMMKW